MSGELKHIEVIKAGKSSFMVTKSFSSNDLIHKTVSTVVIYEIGVTKLVMSIENTYHYRIFTLENGQEKAKTSYIVLLFTGVIKTVVSVSSKY